MSEFNSCAHLVNPDHLEAAKVKYAELLQHQQDPYDYLLYMQNELQNKLADTLKRTPKPTEIKTKGELYDFCMDQKVAFDDEWREIVEAMHGMSRPASERSSCWKKWKSKYDEIRNELVEDMSPEDKLELMFEAVDAAHFFNTILIALGFDAETMFTLYYLKNAENFARQERGY